MSVQYHTSKQGKIKIYHLEGKLIDNIKSVELLEKMNEDITNGTTNFIFDLTNLDYINSNGVNVFLTILRNAKAKGGNICMCNANKKIIELLEMTKLDIMFLNYKSLEKAVEGITN